MMNRKTLKVLGLAGMLAFALLLTGCVVPPDDIDNADNYVVNNGNFQNIAPPVPSSKPSEAPTDAPTDAPTHTPEPVYNWNDPVVQPPSQPTIDQSSIITTVTGKPTQANGQLPPSIVTNLPSATATVLKHGATGAEVRKLQQQLKTLGYYKGSVDGDFGDGTEAAVKAFQKQSGLTADGVAGTKTLNKLYSSNPVKAPAVTNRPTATPTARATATPNLNTDYYLEIGSSGSRVRVLQNRLIELGWLDGKANGEYGAATAHAVMAFQKRYSSLYDDGVAGPSTLKTMYSAGAAKTSSPVASIGETLEMGDEGPAVKALQTRLKELGFLTGKADGSFGQATKAAVIAFQTANGLTADGRAGNGTLNKLFDENVRDADYLKATATPDPLDEEDGDGEEEDVIINGYYVLKEGSRGDEVKKLQRALKNKGLFSSNITGYYGEVTTASVKAFQKQNGLTPDGIAGPSTQILLYAAEKEEENLTSAYETLKPGQSGTKVKNMQYVLKELGYYDGDLDGSYDSATKNAVREFQIANDLTPVDGLAGAKTLERLYSNKAVSANSAPNLYTPLDKGDKGDLVVQLQEALVELGYLSEPTGYFDDATEEAVRNFQRRNNLGVDGEAGQETLKLLYTGKPKTAY